MKNKWIRKPFDVELAKKIQLGEVEGRLLMKPYKSEETYPVIILTCNAVHNRNIRGLIDIVVLVQFEDGDFQTEELQYVAEKAFQIGIECADAHPIFAWIDASKYLPRQTCNKLHVLTDESKVVFGRTSYGKILFVKYNHSSKRWVEYKAGLNNTDKVLENGTIKHWLPIPEL